ncbi:Acetyltransferase (GNAT) family protein [Symmachiella macrocystis]|uniref:Acetyltransferase (GNAT) family protein n=1 Tax=Symmachiella macrocystis TaxID=2527985 RepID=A0A5C6BFZ1_9PLAN|nr:GNAT family N-acetyltransferase [Symmachiella macrocystis]TWU09354.1 Acetyltransferase (GNAT) family protein [Symmachiella macrocystis]
MKLIEPNTAYIESYRSAIAEFEQSGISGFWYSFGVIDDPEEYLRRITQYTHRSGASGDAVPASVYWLVDGGEFIGHTSIRHELNPALEQHGGHIGYAVRPSKHRQGYGRAILGFALPIAHSLGIPRALVTCAAGNTASRKIIENSGGEFVDEVDWQGTTVLRFWVATSQ